jgi:alanyl-tRNA synthetase
MTHQEIRQKYLDYFKEAHHVEVPPASLVPDNDPSVLFTVAGMQQFKDYYQHPQNAPAPRIVTIQPCIRTIDIDEVGDDTHNTVFEMYGHFSFGYTGQDTPDGPYFKKQALTMAWDFLTNVLAIDKNRIRATYFGGDEKRPTDTESKELLQSLDGLSRIEGYGNENFWGPVGDEGPCGPNVEFYIDDVEVWNSVFNEYYKDRDGNYTKAEYRGVDMGGGLERLAAAIQGKPTVYDSDLLSPYITLVRENSNNYNERHGRIVTDHVKAALFLISDGVRPGNKTREYILRRLIRRAVRAGQTIGFTKYGQLMESFASMYGQYYETIKNNYQEAITVFDAEQTKFLKTLDSGTTQLERIITASDNGEISAEQAFKLFDTFGFPIELTSELAAEKNWTVDLTGFQELFNKHKDMSRAGMEKIFQGGLADHNPQTVAHHTAHHLLLASLRHILGGHVVQRGSNVTSERLRIDVSHPEKITEEQLKMAEDLVNQKIAEDLPVISETMDRDKALASGALAEFGTKYPKEVTVYSIIEQDGSVFSRELCGGPHVMSTGELGRFEILKEEGSSAGVRRIRARVVPRTSSIS